MIPDRKFEDFTRWWRQVVFDRRFIRLSCMMTSSRLSGWVVAWLVDLASSRRLHDETCRDKTFAESIAKARLIVRLYLAYGTHIAYVITVINYLSNIYNWCKSKSPSGFTTFLQMRPRVSVPVMKGNWIEQSTPNVGKYTFIQPTTLQVVDVRWLSGQKIKVTGLSTGGLWISTFGGRQWGHLWWGPVSEKIFVGHTVKYAVFAISKFFIPDVQLHSPKFHFRGGQWRKPLTWGGRVPPLLPLRTAPDYRGGSKGKGATLPSQSEVWLLHCPQ